MTDFLIPDAPEPREVTAGKRLRMHTIRSIERFAASYIDGWKQVWERNDGVTPQQVIDQFGTQAYTLFVRSAATRDYILANRPDLLPEQYRAPALPVTPEMVDGVLTGRMIVG